MNARRLGRASPTARPAATSADPVEGVGGPVRREVGAVAPDRAGLLAAAGEVLALARADVLAGQHDLARRGATTRSGIGGLCSLIFGAPEDEDA